ncbi:hypothetical protein EWM64_g9608 [Hericium alpestre]|uniref:Uncharacterized protein n=1 Tax=Hericium alpestre TaxID=135208 RepID=A0A4Y9ZKI0_9AGAM|nr:hypothetical protein EWM64_g9608 [Hericium alpestre]
MDSALSTSSLSGMSSPPPPSPGVKRRSSHDVLLSLAGPESSLPLPRRETPSLVGTDGIPEGVPFDFAASHRTSSPTRGYSRTYPPSACAPPSASLYIFTRAFSPPAARHTNRLHCARALATLADAQIYDPRVRDFVKYEGETELQGPFVYFLAVINVDRLEPTFRIAPLRRSHPASGDNMDLIVVRPRRDASLPADEGEAKRLFGEKIWAVLGKAYEDGAHPDLRYAADGTLSAEGEGENVVEYFRVGGWEWIPVRLSSF